MSNIDKQALTDEAISKAFAGTNFGRDDFKNILAETVIDAAAGWRCGYTATTICTQLGLLTPKGCASALGLRFISEHVQRETKRLKDELEAKDRRLEEEIGRANREHHRGFMMACGHLKEHSNVHYADAAEMEIAAHRKRINELEAREVKLPERYEVDMCPTPSPDGEWYSREDVLSALVSAGLKVAAAGKGEVS
ncbi:hypothetical protein [Enterobacter sp. ECC-019]|uniref:hypothetical protein n=1 Tax=Enterobacter sp. ECC-019 TaxID=3116478 RepID=UPI003754EA6C